MYFFIFNLEADVFSLIPFSGNFNGTGQELENILDGVALKSERIEINGVPCQMKIKLIETDLKTSIEYLCKSFNHLSFKASEDSVLAELLHKNGDIERIYLISMPGGLYPTISFSMIFSNGLPKNNDFWFNDFPLPNLSTVETTMFFPSRQVSYGVFRSNRDTESVKEEVDFMLKESSWEEFSSGVYINETTMEILLVSYAESSNIKSRVFFIKKPLEK